MDKLILKKERVLNLALEKPLRELGFMENDLLVFKKVSGEGSFFIRFPFRDSGEGVFGVNGAVRFDAIENILGNHDACMPTFMIPLHWVKSQREPVEWIFSETKLTEVVDAVVAECRCCLIPFLDKFKDICYMENQLKFEMNYYAQDQRDLNVIVLPLTPDQRIEKLAASYVLSGRIENAKRLIDDYLLKLLNERQLPPVKARVGRVKQLCINLGL